MCLTSAEEKGQDHLPHPAGNASSNAVPRAGGRLCCKGARLAADSCVRFPGGNPDSSIFCHWKWGKYFNTSPTIET